MVCCHAGLQGMLTNLSYQFHMPAFFIISGILFHPKGIYNELKTFGIPILFFGIVNLVYNISLCLSSNNIDDIFNYVGDSIKSLLLSSQITWFQGYWFVFTLMLLRILMEFNVIRKYKYILLIFSIIYCCIDNYLAVPPVLRESKPYHIISSLPFFVIGMGIKEKKLAINYGKFETKLLGLCLFFVLSIIQGRTDLAGYKFGISYLFFLLNAVLGSWLLFNVCIHFPYRKWVETLGIGTFLILGIHKILYIRINIFFFSILHFRPPYMPIFVGILVLIICYPLIYFCKSSFPLLLGKTNRH